MLQVPAVSIGYAPVASNTLAAIARIKREPDEAARLEALLRDVEDMSHLSPELLRRAIEQKCWYHVTPFRSALIRSLELPQSARVLEVGCGGGALTRYLGERGYHVTALETSAELAECARLRCRDLVNVEVVTGFLEHVLVESKFDFVICVDPLFVESEFFDPGLQLMSLCRKVLKSTGTLILSVANPLHNPGEAHVEPSREHVRGHGAPLLGIKRSLASAGFTHSEEYLTFPNHAAPRLLINTTQARADRVSWLPLVKELYRTSEVAEDEIEKWWRAVHAEGLEKQLAPGWLVLAHNHAVHSVLWGAGAGKFFVPTVKAENNDAVHRAEPSVPQGGQGAQSNMASVETCTMVLAHSELVSAVLGASKPIVNGVRDYKDSLVAADQRIDELAFRESVAREQLIDTREALECAEQRHSLELTQEQEARRIREAELGLVLKQYHAVGAMCHDMREEGRKLRDMLDELKRRYVAAEEWGGAMSKRVAEAEQELQQAHSWVVYRWAQKIKGLFGRKTPAVGGV
jgi:2-polyprenyl-3-methyl-5-hydroxy-6-metoxy-1,4-benzoquinol methylase